MSDPVFTSMDDFLARYGTDEEKKALKERLSTGKTGANTKSISSKSVSEATVQRNAQPQVGQPQVGTSSLFISLVVVGYISVLLFFS